MDEDEIPGRGQPAFPDLSKSTSRRQMDFGPLKALLWLALWGGAIVYVIALVWTASKVELVNPTQYERTSSAMASLGRWHIEERLRFVLYANGGLDIFVDRQRLEYADRENAVNSVGTIWCRDASDFLMPVVYLRDKDTGDTLAKYSCLLKNTAAAWKAQGAPKRR
jgi:hypothetical protein